MGGNVVCYPTSGVTLSLEFCVECGSISQAFLATIHSIMDSKQCYTPLPFTSEIQNLTLSPSLEAEHYQLPNFSSARILQ